jgi:hypothetical protein
MVTQTGKRIRGISVYPLEIYWCPGEDANTASILLKLLAQESLKNHRYQQFYQQFKKVPPPPSTWQRPSRTVEWLS